MKQAAEIMAAAVLILLAGHGVSMGAASVPIVIVRSDASVGGEKICLKDVAEIDACASLAQEIGAISLGGSPRPGARRTIKGRRILTLLRSKHFICADAIMKVPDEVKVTRRSQDITEGRYRELLHGYVAGCLGNDADFSLSKFRVTGNRPVPEGNVSIKVMNNCDRKVLGQTSVTAFVYVDGRKTERVMLSAWVHLFQKVVHAACNMKKNKALSKENVELVSEDISKLPLNVVSDMKTVTGKRLKQSVRSGEYLRANMLEDIPVVRKGDGVIIVAESGAVRVSVFGKTLEEGCAGDVIRVENCMSGKTIPGLVVDASTVRARF